MIRRVMLTALLVSATASAFAAEQKAKATTPSVQDDPIGSKLSERLGPYRQIVWFHSEKDETRETWKKEYEQLSLDEKVHYCIFQLRNESWSESFPPQREERYSKTPEATASLELVKLGKSTIPQLLRALDSHVPTKIYRSRHMRTPWLVQDAALDAIENIACTLFDDRRLYGLSQLKEEERERVRRNVAAWWEKNKGRDEIEWATEALFSGTKAHGESQGMAIDSLYHRLGSKSYPLLAKAYLRLPKGREGLHTHDEAENAKVQILQWLLKAPTKDEKAVFASAVHDAPLWVRIDGAEGLWAIDDPSGLEAMVKETEERLLKDSGSEWLTCEYDNLMGFLVRCNAARSREAVYNCLSGRNPYLRERGIYAVPKLRMEKAVRALPGLFDDPFILGGSYTQYVGDEARTVPARRVCDEAAKTFTEVVPDAPRYKGDTAEEQQASIDKLKQWWKENGEKVKWDEKRGVLVRPPNGEH
jgi:hypothetical protein